MLRFQLRNITSYTEGNSQERSVKEELWAGSPDVCIFILTLSLTRVNLARPLPTLWPYRVRVTLIYLGVAQRVWLIVGAQQISVE